jgi:hypothetical protein
MNLQLAICSLRETCALHHTALDTEKSYTHWLIRYAAFLKRPKSPSPVTTEEKMEAFLASLAIAGVPVVPPLGDVALTYVEETVGSKVFHMLVAESHVPAARCGVVKCSGQRGLRLGG